MHTLWPVPFILKKFIELFTNLLTFIYEWFYKKFCFSETDLCCVWEAVISKVSLFPSAEKAHFLLTSRLPVVSLRQTLEKSSISDNSYLRRGLFFVSCSKICDWKEIFLQFVDWQSEWWDCYLTDWFHTYCRRAEGALDRWACDWQNLHSGELWLSC